MRQVSSSARSTNFESTLLGMIATTSEKARRFNPEVSDLFFASIKETRRILRFKIILCLLGVLLLLRRHGLLLRLLTLKIFKHGPEVTMVKGGDFRAIAL
jgi:hypothetical protein